jgi:hypothetical protein
MSNVQHKVSLYNILYLLNEESDRCYRYNIGMSMATISFRVDEGNSNRYEETNFVLHITHCWLRKI